MLTGSVGTLLVVDDERHLRESLAELCEAEGHRVLQAADGDEALALLSSQAPLPDVIFLDLRMPRRAGLAVLEALKAHPRWRRIPVVVLTAFGTSANTIEAMKLGAYDYLVKPFEPDAVLQAVRLALESTDRPADLTTEGKEVERAPGEELLGRSPGMREVFKLIGRVAPADVTVLITGESGTGKELVARALHRHSPRALKPFVPLNCAAIPETLLESELFGYERGAFTGALQPKPGRLELAQGGTLFLDEVGDLPTGIQAKLLRVLQEKSVERLGGRSPQVVDFRLVAATSRDLARGVAEGRFREDLYYRLNVVRVDLPPLRSRRSDIPELASHFLRRYGQKRSDPPHGFSDEAMQRLLAYDYPGNVRELEHLVERAVVLARGPLITAADLPLAASDLREDTASLQDLLALPFAEAVRQLERALLIRALTCAQGNKAEAARRLGIHRQLLYAKLKEHGLESCP